MGGLISQELLARLHRYTDHPVHSLSHTVVTPKTDIVTIHDVAPLLSSANPAGSHYSRIFKNALNTETIIVPSHAAKNDLLMLGVPEEKINVIYEGIDTSQFFYDPFFILYWTDHVAVDGKKVLVTVGDYNPRKRFDLLYDIVSKMDDIVLYHIGPENNWNKRAQYLRRLASKSGNVFILGDVPREVLRKFYSSSDLFVYISDAEGFGLPPLEAMACGTNVLVNDIPVFRETMGGVGFLSSIQDFREGIYHALDHRKSRTVLREYVKKFSVQKEINEMIKIYERWGQRS
ncbi:MAG: glycosyltransferase [Thermoplasmatales archaeon]